MLSLELIADLVEKNRAATQARVREFTLGGREFRFNSEPAIMGVVNLSAGSWDRESVCLTAESAIARGKVLAAQGAAIVDIGAESTLANAELVGAELQKSRLLPVVRELCAAGVLVSVETYQPEVTQACLGKGACDQLSPRRGPAVDDGCAGRHLF